MVKRMDTDPAAVARRAIRAINDRSVAEQAHQLMEPSMVRHDLVRLFPDGEGPAAGSDFVKMIAGVMPDFRLDIEDIFSAGDRATVRLQMSGTHTGLPLLGRQATGKKLSASAMFIYRVRNGRIAEAWQMVDGLAFYRLAGLLD
jgi:predicted ester cyclase